MIYNILKITYIRLYYSCIHCETDIIFFYDLEHSILYIIYDICITANITYGACGMAGVLRATKRS